MENLSLDVIERILIHIPREINLIVALTCKDFKNVLLKNNKILNVSEKYITSKLNLLKYAIKNGYVCDYGTWYLTMKNKNLECLKYAFYKLSDNPKRYYYYEYTTLKLEKKNHGTLYTPSLTTNNHYYKLFPPEWCDKYRCFDQIDINKWVDAVKRKDDFYINMNNEIIYYDDIEIVD